MHVWRLWGKCRVLPRRIIWVIHKGHGKYLVLSFNENVFLIVRVWSQPHKYRRLPPYKPGLTMPYYTQLGDWDFVKGQAVGRGNHANAFSISAKRLAISNLGFMDAVGHFGH